MKVSGATQSDFLENEDLSTQNSCAFLTDGSVLTGGTDGCVRLFRGKDAKEGKIVLKFSKEVKELSASPTVAGLFVACESNQLVAKFTTDAAAKASVAAEEGFGFVAVRYVHACR